MKKKTLIGLLTLTLSLSMLLSACGLSGNVTDNSDNAPSVNDNNNDDGEIDEKPDADASSGVSLANPEYLAIDGGEIREELTSLEATMLMGNGINLGNTMEAYGHSSLGILANPTSYETFWGQPVTTLESVAGMKAAGFDTIRIPVAWTNMMDFENGDYTINSAYLDRVEEIVSYARSADMYVIINDHWDGGWWGMFGSASDDTKAAARELYVSMWTQISEKFRDYSDYVIFEGANEEVGFRLNDNDNPMAKDSGTLSDDQCYEVANEINQLFVDTVRSTGGNNENRFLLVAGFGTDISNTCNSKFVMPTDTASSKLMISVHYYDPSGYCIGSAIDKWGSKDEFEAMNKMLYKMQRFTSDGIGVVIGEYGVLIENQSTPKEGTIPYINNFLDNCDQYNYCPVLWDCNNMYNRNACVMNFDDVAEVYLDRSYNAQSGMSQEEIVAKAKEAKEESIKNAEAGFSLSADEAVAWIMFTSSDWGIMYSVGDVYDPTSASAGIVADDPIITGEGTYTVSLDISGTSGGYADGTAFCALGIANAEKLFPGYYIEITSIKINGEEIELVADYYTTSDDNLCTRVNIYNEWVSAVPDTARRFDGDLTKAAPVIIDSSDLSSITDIEITFDFVAP